MRPDGRHGERGIAVQTASAYDVRSVGEYGFSGVECNLLGSPIDFFTPAVRNVARQIGRQFDLLQLGNVDVCVVTLDGRIVHGPSGFVQGFGPAWNDGVGVNLALHLSFHHGGPKNGWSKVWLAAY